MTKHIQFSWIVSISTFTFLISFWAMADDSEQVATSSQGLMLTALDRYVRSPDSTYRFELVKTFDEEGYTGYILDMISQEWLTEQEVDRTSWQHFIQIVRPVHVATDTGLLFIGGGSNGKPPPERMSEMLITLAMGAHSVVAQIGTIPNQPLTLKAEGIPRKEDALIAYTWDQYLRTGDEKWPLRLPMTKAVVRAMDTITAFCASEAGGSIKVEKYTVAGGSKRGWTTWTTAAVDSRVVAICPIVIDMLNVIPSFIHHFEVYGRYAEAVGDYEEMNIMSWTEAEEYKRLMEIVEPYEYRKRLTLPKFLLNSAGDQFFVPDSSQFYFKELEGEKYLRYVPNTDHGLDDSDALESLLSWYHAIVHNVPRPRFNWTVSEDGTIRLLTLDKPAEVRLWQATNIETRDFRKETIGHAWTSEILQDLDGGTYIGQVETPEKGWTAYFIELTFRSGTKIPFKFTTDVVVVPKTKPFKYTPSKPADHAPGFLSK